MSKSSSSPSWPQLEPVETEADGRQLRTAIEEMQSMTVSACEQIIVVGRLGQILLEKPMTPAHQEMLAQALNVVIEKAGMTIDSVSYEAENVGIVYTDEAKARRAAAHRT